MKIKIAHNEREYTLGFTRATAMEMAKIASKFSRTNREANLDVAIDEAETLINFALKADQPGLSKEEVGQITKFVLDNYQLIDKEENGQVKKGLMSYLTDMILGCMPKGFTGQATMEFAVVE